MTLSPTSIRHSRQRSNELTAVSSTLMPITLDRDLAGSGQPLHSNCCWRSPNDTHESAENCLSIGLLNNMPDAALQATERQFSTLLNASAHRIVVRLSLYALPDIPRGASARTYINRFYSTIEKLWDSHLDGLIVTGTEPRSPNLVDEPYWGSLTRVLDWADDNTYSTICSCLAAHAAVLHTDGIGRRPLDQKRFGVFEFTCLSGSGLMKEAPRRFRMPHSRWNDLPEDELTSCDYRVLTRNKNAGVDTFVKKRKSLFVFFQGHPEYETNSLLLEYRRDVGRYLRKEREFYPEMPQGYFDSCLSQALRSFRQRAIRNRREEFLAEFPASHVAANVANTWFPAAVGMYGNWLAHLCAEKRQRFCLDACRS